MASDTPLLLLDVDGVISLFGFPHTDPPAGQGTVVDGIPHWISAAAGPQIARLQPKFECVWCTGWEEKANEHLPFLLGLEGPFPYLELAPSGSARHWKLDAIDAYAGPDRPVAWVDDSLDATCWAWAEERTGETLLIVTEPHIGLTDDQVEELLGWAAGL